MPDGKITRQKIRDHLRRLWLVYLAGIVALVFLNNLVYTLTRSSHSEDETLKIMLLNADIEIEEAALLEKAEQLGFAAVETVELSVAPEDPTSRMLLVTQLVSGYGDIYITDEAGLAVLNERDACHTARRMRDGLHAVVVRGGTDVESALGAMEILMDEMGE